MRNFFNQIVAKYIVKPIDEYEYEYVCKYGLQEKGELGKYLHIHFCNLLYKIYSKSDFLYWLLCSLCELEMQLSYFFDKEKREILDSLDFQDIPTDMLYCQGCAFADRSKLADFIFGNQESGYCWYLGKGDFSYHRPTLLLWDGCKECGVNDDPDDEWETDFFDTRDSNEPLVEDLEDEVGND